MWRVLCASARHRLRFHFFFQAEDGIRDLTVTGVQTCALPISGDRERYPPARAVPMTGGRDGRMLHAVIPAGGSGTRLWPLSRAGNPKFLHPLTGKIGRASCRERV